MDRALKLAKVGVCFFAMFALGAAGYAGLRYVVEQERVASAAVQVSADIHATAVTAQGRLYRIDVVVDKATAVLEQHRLAGVKLNRLADALNDPTTGVPALLANANEVVSKAKELEAETLTDQKKAGAAMDALRNLLESDDLQASLASETVAMRKLAAMSEKGESILRHADNIMANGDKKVDQLVNPTKKQRIVQGLKDAGHWATVILRLFL